VDGSVLLYAPAIAICRSGISLGGDKKRKGKAPMTVSFVGCKVALTLAGLLTVMIALIALGVWVWVPH
jgi:hypothetical protein